MDIEFISIAVTTATIAAAAAWYIFRYCNSSHKDQQIKKHVESTLSNKSKKNQMKQPKKGKKDREESRFPHKKSKTPSDALFVTALKGHTSPVLDAVFTPCGKGLATCSEDRTIRVWKRNTLHAKEPSYVQTNVDLDHVTHLRFSTSGKAAVGSLSRDRAVRLFKVSHGLFSHVADIGKDLNPLVDIVAIGLAANTAHQYVLLCFGDTALFLLSSQGQVLEKINTQMHENYWAAVSDCGAYFGCSGFAPGVKLWSVTSENGHFVKATRSMHLGGHTSGTVHFSFSRDSTRIATVSCDGSWQYFSISQRWKEGEECRVLAKGPYKQPCKSAQIAISSSNYTLAVGAKRVIELFSTTTSNQLYIIDEAHFKGNITALAYSSDDEVFVSAIHNRVHVWKNLPHKAEVVDRLKESLSSILQGSTKKRIRDQIESLSRELREHSYVRP